MAVLVRRLGIGQQGDLGFTIFLLTLRMFLSSTVSTYDSQENMITALGGLLLELLDVRAFGIVTSLVGGG